MSLEIIKKLTLRFYLKTLALLPWSWFPPFPWLHAHAQWSDVVFAVTAFLWLVERWRSGERPVLRLPHTAMAFYVGFAAISLTASADKATGAMKLLGIAELCMLAVITADMAGRPKVLSLIVRVIAATSLVAALASVVGLILFYAHISTPLIGTYGDLMASSGYARVQAGTYQPNMLANFCIFAAAVIANENADLPRWFRRLTMGALWITVTLTFSRGIFGFVLAAAIRGSITGRRRVLTSALAVIFAALMTTLALWNLTINPVRPLDADIDVIEPSSRRQAIATSWKTLITRPLTGSGIGTLPGSYRAMPFDAHMTPLNIAATMGLPALAAFVALIISLWRGRSRPTDVAVWSGLAGMGLDAMAQDIEDFRHLWVLFGLGMKKVESGDKTPSRQD